MTVADRELLQELISFDTGSHASPTANDSSTPGACQAASAHARLQTPTGRAALRKWFAAHAEAGSASENAAWLNAAAPAPVLGEAAFTGLLRRLLDWPDHELLNMYDALTAQRACGVGYGELFVALAVLAAEDPRQRREALCMYGAALHAVAARALPASRWMALRMCGKLLDVSPTTLRASSAALRIDPAASPSLQEFELLLIHALDCSQSAGGAAGQPRSAPDPGGSAASSHAGKKHNGPGCILQ